MTPGCREQRQRRYRGHLGTKRGSGCPHPLAPGSSSLPEVRRAGEGSRGQPGHSRAGAPPKARSRNESLEIASQEAPRTGPSRVARLASAPDGASEGLRQRCERALPAAWRGVKAQKPLAIYLFIYWEQCMGDTQKASEPWKKKKNHTTSGPKREQEEWDSSLDPYTERKVSRKKENTEKPCKHQTCRLLQVFFASLRTNILLTAMQHKGIMLIVFLEYFISGHGEAGKKNKSILPFWNNFILNLARGKGIEIRSVCGK